MVWPGEDFGSSAVEIRISGAHSELPRTAAGSGAGTCVMVSDCLTRVEEEQPKLEAAINEMSTVVPASVPIRILFSSLSIASIQSPSGAEYLEPPRFHSGIGRMSFS